MNERRRSPRYVVKHVTATLLSSVEGKLVQKQASVLTVETARQVPFDRPCELLMRTQGGAALRRSGRVRSCRLGEIRTLPNGRTMSVYETDVELTDPVAVGDTVEMVTIESGYPAAVKNISPYGALLESELPLMVGSSSVVQVRSGDASFQAKLSVVFSREVGDQTGNRLCQVGVEFVGIDQAQRAAIEKLVFGALVT
ncbi:MAG TPA: PilZ domain-containing protein [Thermoanaerobaculaceae bacterium]|nr:PilZ domain-containing protein [Thermoanaerobaculaceae bacterium]HPS79603.1 PilZ domain-containing protein [Thermoanaerobaculaceae bacterium]